MTDKHHLMREIDRISFSMDELRLFLDTHPTCREALSAFAELRKRREKLLRSYEDSYGPMEAYCAGGKERWNWPAQPWPWEKEA